MTQKVGMTDYVSLALYEKEPETIRAVWIAELKFRAAKEGYELKSEPIGVIWGYATWTEKGFTPVNKDKADFVHIGFTAEVKPIEVM
jgi:hypothetical protein